MACITLSTDLGYQDPSVGMVKGVLMQYVPGTPLVDLTHSLRADYYQAAAYAIERAYRHFPRESVHLILYDLFADRAPRLLHVAHEGHHFLAPDNGLLPLVFKEALSECRLCYAPDPPVRFWQWVHKAASMCSKILDGGLSGPPTDEEKTTAIRKIVSTHPSVPVPSVDCSVIYVDHFGNVVLDITRQQFEAIANGRAFRIGFRGTEEISEIRDNYYEVGANDKMCRFNGTGYLEIAIRGANASQLLGMRLYKEGHLLYRHIKILFA